MSYERSPHVILEIECGDYPFPRLGKRMPTQGELYVGLDRFTVRTDDDVAVSAQGLRLMALTRYAQLGWPTPLGDMELVRGDSRELPIRDGAADEVVAVDVFGNREGYADHGQVALEAARVLHEDGQLTVVETRSPRPLDAPPIEGVLSLRGLMLQAGLVQVNRGLEQLSVEAIAKYAHPSSAIRWGAPAARDYTAIFMHRQHDVPQASNPT